MGCCRLLVVLGALTLAGRAFAADPMPPAPAPEQAVAPPLETGRTMAQFLVGTGVAFGGLFLAGATIDADASGVLMVMAVTPALVGAGVNAAGNGGAYQGSYLAATLGAYAGAISIVPLVYIGAAGEQHESQVEYAIPGRAIAGFLVGWLLVQPLVATLGWQLSKQPRALVATATPRTPLVSRAPGQRLLPLLSLAF